MKSKVFILLGIVSVVTGCASLLDAHYYEQQKKQAIVDSETAFKYMFSVQKHDGAMVFLGADSISGRNDVFIMNSDGTGFRNLTNTPGGDEGFPGWTDEGRVVYVALPDRWDAHMRELWKYYMVNADGTDRKEIGAGLFSRYDTMFKIGP